VACTVVSVRRRSTRAAAGGGGGCGKGGEGALHRGAPLGYHAALHPATRQPPATTSHQPPARDSAPLRDLRLPLRRMNTTLCPTRGHDLWGAMVPAGRVVLAGEAALLASTPHTCSLLGPLTARSGRALHVTGGQANCSAHARSSGSHTNCSNGFVSVARVVIRTFISIEQHVL
jgi:hypothetical protein